jgi:hypothetical protein
MTGIMKKLLLMIAIGLVWPALAWSQPPPSTEQMVSVDPIRCWWRTSEGAVRLGQTFDLALTCAVLDNEAVQVVPDESRLAGAVISMAPFEIVGSVHPADMHAGERRFFQYGYTLRIINPDAIGSDIPIPLISLHYRVNSKIAANASVQGRDLTYILPPQSIRVLSLVTADAVDIRDSSEESFQSVESLLVHASMLDLAALTLAVLGALMVIVVLVRLLAGVRKEKGPEAHLMGQYTLLRHAGRELAAAGRDADGGWTADLAGRALAATRIAAACALDRSVTQKPATAVSPAGDGRVVARGLLGRGKATTLSSGVTHEDVSRALSRLPSGAEPAKRQTLEELQTALGTFNRYQYGREPQNDKSALDAALTAAQSATSRLKSDAMWPKPFLRRRLSSWRAVEAESRT